METIWEFKINGQTVEEPIGWDSVVFELQRDPIYLGLENIISDGIKFWDTGAYLITQEYNLHGVDGSLTFDVFYSCDEGITFTSLFSGIINCFFYEVINNEVSVKLEPSGFHRKVKNRLSTPVNLLSNTSIGGLPMSTINPFDLGLHSKAISFYTNEVLNVPIKTFTLSNDLNLVNPPMTVVTSDIVGFTEMTAYTPPSILFTNSTSQNRTIRVKGRFKFTHKIQFTTSAGGGATYSYGGAFKLIAGDIVAGFTTIYTAPLGTSGPDSWDISFDQNIILGPGQNFYLVFWENVANDPIYSPITASVANWDFDPVSEVEFFDNSLFNPSTTKAFLIHETFAKISESITDIQDSFRSDYFGRTDSLPFSYPETGCGAWKAVTNGLNIRKMHDKFGNFFPIVTTFQDLFDAADCERCLGMRVEKDYNTGKEYIRVEPREFFYNSSSILNTFNVSDLKRSPAQDLIYNNFKIGYVKWNLNITGSNALDEFNSDRSYSIPVKNAANKLERISKYIASGYLIEQTRRLQFNKAPTNDFETDNDLFFISTNRNTVISDLYTVPAVSTTYAPGTVSERNENFSSINNVLSPDTCYNLRLSPVRNALNWFKWISASIWKQPTSNINFISGTGNYQEGDTMSGDCIVSSTVLQNQNLNLTNLSGIDATTIFSPEYLEFTYPLSYDEFLNILSNSEKAIQVSCSNESMFIGFIISLKYSPTTQGGIGSFKLLGGNCALGDFNNDFNNDFFTSAC